MTDYIKIAKFIVDEPDHKGQNIERILSKDNEYIIYIAKGQLQIAGQTDKLDNNEDAQKMLAKIMGLAPMTNYKRRNFFMELSGALELIISGNSVSGMEVLELLYKRQRENKLEIGKHFYLLGGILTTLVTCVAVSIFYFKFQIPQDKASELAWGLVDTRPLYFFNDQMFARASLHRTLWYALALGSLGGILSIATRMRSLNINPYSHSVFNLSTGAVRVVIAMIGACFAFLAIKAELINASSNTFFCFTLYFLAGFSETLIPNTLRKMEQKTKEEDSEELKQELAGLKQSLKVVSNKKEELEQALKTDNNKEEKQRKVGPKKRKTPNRRNNT